MVGVIGRMWVNSVRTDEGLMEPFLSMEVVDGWEYSREL